MANFSTVRDLRLDALWVAGEAQTSASSYYTRSLEYLNAVLMALISGGPMGLLTLPAIDWSWAHQTKRGQLVIPNAINVQGGVTCTFTQNSTTLSFSSSITPSMAGYRLANTQDQDQIMYVLTHTSGTTSATTDLAWQKATTTQVFTAWVDQVALPTDFTRFTTPLKMGRYPYEIEITDMQKLEQKFPRSRLWLGTPACAAVMPLRGATDQQYGLHFSHMLQDGPIVPEFEYLAEVTEMVDSTGLEVPPLPVQHRRVLSLGASYLMLFDKVDAKYTRVGQMFMDAWEAMAEEHYRQTSDNENFGRILSRQNEVASKRFPLRSPSGFIYG